MLKNNIKCLNLRSEKEPKKSLNILKILSCYRTYVLIAINGGYFDGSRKLILDKMDLPSEILSLNLIKSHRINGVIPRNKWKKKIFFKETDQNKHYLDVWTRSLKSDSTSWLNPLYFKISRKRKLFSIECI